MRGVRSVRHGHACLAPVIVAAAVLCGSAAHAQTDADLDAARRLFREAVADQEATRYETALDKFRRVDAVKETANVLFRMATCLEALGRRADALDGYERAMRAGEAEKGSADAVAASAARASQLARIVPRLTLQLPAQPPEGLEVRIDDKKVEPDSLKLPIAVDPGSHTIDATAPSTAPFHTTVTLDEGARVTLAIPLRPNEAPPRSEPAAPPPAPAPTPPPTSPSHTPAVVAFSVGGVLAAGAVVSFVLQALNVSTLNECPSSSGKLFCPESDRGAYDAAKVEGPLAIGLAAGAAVALGVGVWLVVSTPSRSSASGAFFLAPRAVGGQGALLLVGWQP